MVQAEPLCFPLNTEWHEQALDGRGGRQLHQKKIRNQKYYVAQHNLIIYVHLVTASIIYIHLVMLSYH